MECIYVASHAHSISMFLNYWLSLEPRSQVLTHTNKKLDRGLGTRLQFGWNVRIYVASHALLQFYILEVKIRLSIITLVTYSA